MIYFDNAATTRPSKKVCDIVADMLYNNFGNPSSLHKLGYEAESIMNENREKIASFIGARDDEIYFTSGGTESNNWAIIGASEANKRYGNTIVTSRMEHPSVAETMNVLSEKGYDICYIDTDKRGYIDISDLLSIVKEKKVILISLMHVNNETGTIENIAEIAKEVKKISPDTVFHSDGVQGFGKHRIDLKNIDLYSFSAHKIHAPKGIGGLYIKKGTKIRPLINGGMQQSSLRPGTENTAYIAAFAAACEDIFKNTDVNLEKVSKIKYELMKIENEAEGFFINGDKENSTPYILSLAVENVGGEVLTHALEKRGIYISTGSACSSKNKKKKSPIDYISPLYKKNTVRISFNGDNCIEEALEVKKAIIEEAQMLRRYVKR